jgi:hypothetical protein
MVAWPSMTTSSPKVALSFPRCSEPMHGQGLLYHKRRSRDSTGRPLSRQIADATNATAGDTIMTFGLSVRSVSCATSASGEIPGSTGELRDWNPGPNALSVNPFASRIFPYRAGFSSRICLFLLSAILSRIKVDQVLKCRLLRTEPYKFDY